MTTLPREGAILENVYHFPVRVYYEDTDAAGIVYYANYFKFAERARTEMLRLLGIEQELLRITTGLTFVVKRCSADFLQPARLDDDLLVITQLESIHGASVNFIQEVARADTILVRLNFQIACVSRNGRAHRLPSRFREAIQILVT
jgi:acyl-CoA thioester hydrolase